MRKKGVSMNKKTYSLREDRLTDFLITLPGFFLYCLLFITPVCMGFYYSLTNWNGVSKTYDMIGLQNYINLAQDSRFLSTVSFTVRYTVLLILFVIVISLANALVLSSKMKGSAFFRAVFFFPAVLGLITVGLIFKELYYRALPVIGTLLNIEVLKTNILASADLAIYGILAANVWTACAIPTLLFYAGIKNVPHDLYEAADIDGASFFQKFFKITVPYLVPTFSMVFILQLKSGLSVFDYVMAITDGGPGGATESIGTMIYSTAFEEWRFGYATAESVVLFFIIALISLLQIRASKNKGVIA